jgi:L-threonylcarbamoyladenylate synthase
MVGIRAVVVKGNDRGAVELASKIIIEGGVVAAPTESSYCLACDATNARAVKRIFAIKKRDAGKGIPVVFSDVRMARKYCALSQIASHLVKEFMPGALTLVADSRGGLARGLSKSGVAFRIPGNKFLRELVEECGVPLTATSANFSREPAIYDAKELEEKFLGKIDLIVDAGKLERRKASTIVDVRGEPAVLREGAVNPNKVLAEVQRFERGSATVVLAGCMVLRTSGGRKKVLLTRSSILPEGRLHLPKGHARAGETLEAAALRELFEETGLRAKIVRKLGVIRRMSVLGKRELKEIHVFSAKPEANSFDSRKAQWVPLAVAAEKIFPEEDRRFFQKLFGG